MCGVIPSGCIWYAAVLLQCKERFILAKKHSQLILVGMKWCTFACEQRNMRLAVVASKAFTILVQKQWNLLGVIMYTTVVSGVSMIHQCGMSLHAPALLNFAK